MNELDEAFAEFKDRIAIDVIPQKEDPYVCYSVAKKGFYVSTTDRDEFDGYTTMESITNLFIDNYERGKGGSIDHKDAEPFLNELKKAIKQIESRVEAKNPRVNP